MVPTPPHTPRGCWCPLPLLGSTVLPQGSVSMGILGALWVVDACSLSEFDENFLIFFILNGNFFFFSELAKTSFSFYFLSTFGGWVGVSDPNVDKSTFLFWTLHEHDMHDNWQVRYVTEILNPNIGEICESWYYISLSCQKKKLYILGLFTVFFIYLKLLVYFIIFKTASVIV